MAVCPKCGYKLKLTDWRPECPKCGVNLVYYGMEDRLRDEADKAEREHALFQPKVDRMKAALIGSGVSKVRLGLCIAPILAMLLPMGKVSINLPYYTKSFTVNLISVIKIFSDYFDFNRLTKIIGTTAFKSEGLYYAIALFSFALVLVISIINILFQLLACSPKGLPRNFITAGVGIADVLVCGFSYYKLCTSLAAEFPTAVTGTISWGLIGLLLTFVALIVINVIYKKKKIQVKYTDVSELLLPYAQRPSVIEKKKKAAAAAAAGAAENEGNGEEAQTPADDNTAAPETTDSAGTTQA